MLQKQKILNHAYVLLAVLLGFVLFDGSSASDGFAKLSALFGGGGLPLWNTESRNMDLCRSDRSKRKIMRTKRTKTPKRKGARMPISRI